MHYVNSGECIVLMGSNNDILMVDCGDTASGSLSRIMSRYSRADSRNLILTHYELDELNILMKLFKIKPDYFNSIFLPISPCDKKGRPLLLEFALFVFAFYLKKDEFRYQNEFLLRIFGEIIEKSQTKRISVLKEGSLFNFDTVEYDVLWPKENNYRFTDLFVSAVDDMDVLLSSPFQPKEAHEFLNLKKEFCSAYLNAVKSKDVNINEITHMNTILNSILKLKPKLRLLPNAPDVTEILERPSTHTSYAHEICTSSLIFQNKRKSEASTDDILMTGDASPESLDAVADKLYDGYYILKAPRHGVSGAWSHLFNEISASHILISNGNNRLYGNISEEYTELSSIKHCTDCTGCSWYLRGGCSCNRLNCCYELSPPGLSVKCPFCGGLKNVSPCKIYVVSSSGRSSCLCDGKPININ